jgi:hypothetical protein
LNECCVGGIERTFSRANQQTENQSGQRGDHPGTTTVSLTHRANEVPAVRSTKPSNAAPKMWRRRLN